MGRRHGLGEKGLSVSGFSAKGDLVVFEELAPHDRQVGEALWLFVIHALVLSASPGVTAVQRPGLASISPHAAVRGHGPIRDCLSVCTGTEDDMRRGPGLGRQWPGQPAERTGGNKDPPRLREGAGSRKATGRGEQVMEAAGR